MTEQTAPQEGYYRLIDLQDGSPAPFLYPESETAYYALGVAHAFADVLGKDSDRFTLEEFVQGAWERVADIPDVIEDYIELGGADD